MGTMEGRRRSLVKALSWRALAVVITASVAYAVTREMEIAAAVGVADAAIKLGMYYAHERMWSRIGYGLHRVESAARERSEEQ